MNKAFIEPNTKKLYEYYWNQIVASVGDDDAKDFEVTLLNHRPDDLNEGDVYKNEYAYEWCKYSIMALLIEASIKDKYVGHALKLLKNNKFNESEPNYISDIINSLPLDTIKKISSQKKVVDIDELRKNIQQSINKYYKEHERTLAPDENLRDELQKVVNGSLEAANNFNKNKKSFNFSDNSDLGFKF